MCREESVLLYFPISFVFLVNDPLLYYKYLYLSHCQMYLQEVMIFLSALISTLIACAKAESAPHSGVIFEEDVPFGRNGYFPNQPPNKIWFVYLEERLSSTETRGSLMVR